MEIGKSHFLDVARAMGIPAVVRRQLERDRHSVLNYALKVISRDMPEANDVAHSHRVAQHCCRLEAMMQPRLTSRQRLVLLYAALLHDIAKTNNEPLQKSIRASLQNRDPSFAADTADHGVRSSHYVKYKVIKKEFVLPGLPQREVEALLHVISFHSTGTLFPAFISERGRSFADVALCLVFRLADVSDGAHWRAEASATASAALRPAKTNARVRVQRIGINRECISWHVDRQSSAIVKAIQIENAGLAKHAALLRSMGLPFQIELSLPGKRPSQAVRPLPQSALEHADLYNNAKARSSPLVLSSRRFWSLYEDIVAAFHTVQARGAPAYTHYSGPVVLEVTDSEDDEVEKTRIRSAVGVDIETVRNYTELWLSRARTASEHFYFGYTHGQRIKDYLYPQRPDDLDQKFREWNGHIDQLKTCRRRLAQGGKDARRAYVVIPHPLVDNEASRFYNPEVITPSLIAVHFRLEAKNKLAGFAMLRSQELSLFSVVNYLEVKALLNDIIKEWEGPSAPALGRIVMMSSLAYFDPSTVLLDKPGICKIGEAELRQLAGKVADDPAAQRKVNELLQEFAAREYFRVDGRWCKPFAAALPRAAVALAKAVRKLGEELKKLDSPNPTGTVGRAEIVARKKELVADVLKALKGKS